MDPRSQKVTDVMEIAKGDTIRKRRGAANMGKDTENVMEVEVEREMEVRAGLRGKEDTRSASPTKCENKEEGMTRNITE